MVLTVLVYMLELAWDHVGPHIAVSRRLLFFLLPSLISPRSRQAGGWEEVAERPSDFGSGSRGVRARGSRAGARVWWRRSLDGERSALKRHGGGMGEAPWPSTRPILLLRLAYGGNGRPLDLAGPSGEAMADAGKASRPGRRRSMVVVLAQAAVASVAMR